MLTQLVWKTKALIEAFSQEYLHCHSEQDKVVRWLNEWMNKWSVLFAMYYDGMIRLPDWGNK